MTILLSETIFLLSLPSYNSRWKPCVVASLSEDLVYFTVLVWVGVPSLWLVFVLAGDV